MGYMHITNLYRPEAQAILLFKEVYALEKVHGTSAHEAELVAVGVAHALLLATVGITKHRDLGMPDRGESRSQRRVVEEGDEIGV